MERAPLTLAMPTGSEKIREFSGDKSGSVGLDLGGRSGTTATTLRVGSERSWRRVRTVLPTSMSAKVI